MFEEVASGTKTKDEESSKGRRNDETNCYEKTDNLLNYCTI